MAFLFNKTAIPLKQFRLLQNTVFFLLIIVSNGMAQNIRGRVVDEQGNALQFANIFVRELQTGTVTDEKGEYFLNIDPGIYNIVVSSVGYESLKEQIIVKDKSVSKDFTLRQSKVALEEVTVQSKRKDPAYEIIQNVIENKEKYLEEFKSYKSKVYVKAYEVVDKKEKESKKLKENHEEDELSQKTAPTDPFEKERKRAQEKLSQSSFLEMQLVLNFELPKQFKEERTAYKLYGSREGLYIPVFNEVNINFYQNLVRLPGLNEVPIISPLSKTAILSYKYKLEDSYLEGNQIIYKIKVIPRKIGDATCKGFLYINDSKWSINKLELTLEKGGLRFYDFFTMKQTYETIDGSSTFPTRQEFTYSTKSGSKTFKGNTLIKFTELQKDFLFPPKFFGNEVSITAQEAYERDSSFWNSSRIEALTEEEKTVIAYKDSVEAALNDKHYLDSLEAKYNKITVGEVLLHGLGFRNDAKKSRLYCSSLLGLVGFEVVGGFRIGPSGGYFRRFESGRMLNVFAGGSIGLKNSDPQGHLSTWFRYDPFRQGDLTVKTGRSFYSINSFDAYLNQLKISNYIVHDHLDVGHRIELFNGFFLRTDAGFHLRKSIDGYDKRSVINEVIKEDSAYSFQDYETFFTDVRISYTPFQRYMREPKQKVILGSKYPTFSIGHKKGWDNVFGSDVDFDFVDFSIDQNLQLGMLGNSRYNFTVGKFLNTKKLEFIDVKRFRQSDPFLYSDPLHSFQILDTALNTKNWFFEAHFIHHFNGAMINNIPIVKKTKIRTVIGGGFMYIQESNFRHTELFGGVERVFKVGARRRLRLGVYGVVGQSNQSSIQTGYKISFDLIDTWKRDWSF